MNLRASLCLFASLVMMLPLRAQDSDGESEEMITLSPFSVSNDDDVGYSVSSALAGARLAANLADPNAGRLPNVPISIVKRADALAVSCVLVNTGEKQDKRNAELYASIESMRAEIGRVPGLRFEHRQVRFASGNRSKLSFSRTDATTSHAAILILAELPSGIDVVKQVKLIRETIQKATLQGQTKLVDGVVGLYLKTPAKYRREILDRIFEDLGGLKKSLGGEFELLPTGFNQPVRMRVCSETDVELWIDYSFTIRSIREIEASKK